MELYLIWVLGMYALCWATINNGGFPSGIRDKWLTVAFIVTWPITLPILLLIYIIQYTS